MEFDIWLKRQMKDKKFAEAYEKELKILEDMKERKEFIREKASMRVMTRLYSKEMKGD
jgi:hypothetical protein